MFFKIICISNLNFIQNIRPDRDEGKPPTKKSKIGTQSHHLQDDVYTPLSQGSIVDRDGERSSPGERVHLEVSYVNNKVFADDQFLLLCLLGAADKGREEGREYRETADKYGEKSREDPCECKRSDECRKQVENCSSHLCE